MGVNVRYVFGFCSYNNRRRYAMSFPELFLIALGLSMDAFAVSVCQGLSLPRLRVRYALLIGLYFGVF